MACCCWQAVRWVVKMYSAGQCVDWRLCYNAYAPSLSHMIEHLKQQIRTHRQQDSITLVPIDHMHTVSLPFC